MKRSAKKISFLPRTERWPRAFDIRQCDNALARKSMPGTQPGTQKSRLKHQDNNLDAIEAERRRFDCYRAKADPAQTRSTIAPSAGANARKELLKVVSGKQSEFTTRVIDRRHLSWHQNITIVLLLLKIMDMFYLKRKREFTTSFRTVRLFLKPNRMRPAFPEHDRR